MPVRKKKKQSENFQVTLKSLILNVYKETHFLVFLIWLIIIDFPFATENLTSQRIITLQTVPSPHPPTPPKKGTESCYLQTSSPGKT